MSRLNRVCIALAVVCDDDSVSVSLVEERATIRSQEKVRFVDYSSVYPEKSTAPSLRLVLYIIIDS
jgi:hypothetical protein